MPILNYTTSINADKTVMEIQKILRKYAAQYVLIEYDGFQGYPVALTFTLSVRTSSEGHTAEVNYRLPSNYRGVHKVLKGQKGAKKTEEQAVRVAWRIIKDWLEAQMAIIESNQADLAEVFLPYAVTNTGQTLYQKFIENNQLMLTE